MAIREGGGEGKRKTMMTNKYPEHEKLKACQREVSALSNFFDFLAEQEWEIAKFDDRYERLLSIRERPDKIIGMFLKIDPKKLEAEKQAMLDEIRATNNPAETERT